MEINRDKLGTTFGIYISNLKMLSRLIGRKGIIAGLVLPSFLLVEAYFIEKVLGTQNFILDQSYLSFVALGMIIYPLISVMTYDMGSSVREEQIQGTFEIIIFSTPNFVSWYLGKLLASLTFSIPSMLFYTLFYTLTNGWEDTHLLSVFIGLCIIILSSLAIGIFLGGISIYMKDPFPIMEIFSLIITLTSGILFPIKVLPESIQIIALLNPLTFGIELFRNGLTSNSINYYSLIQPIVIIISLLIFSLFVFRRYFRKAKLLGYLLN